MTMGSSSRVSQACNPCRAKKRRCDGERPICGLCSRLNTQCEYRTFDSRYNGSTRSHPSSPRAGEGSGSSGPFKNPSISHAEPSPRFHPDRVSALKANSGALSADLVRQDLGSTKSTHTAPFNLGIRTERQVCDARPVYEVISLAEYDKLAPAYFQKIHVLQGTFSEALFNRKKRERWGRQAQQGNNAYPSECFDLLFAVVGAISALFSGGSPHEAALTECATLHLHQHMLTESLSAYDVDGLLLRSLYLRMTGGPRAAWLSSTMCMTALQDSLIRTRAGPQSTGLRGAIYELDHADVPEVPDILHEKRYRLAKNINDWTSNESGRPKAFPTTFPYRDVPISEEAVGPGWEMLHLATMSQRLDPDDYDMDAEGLEKLMSRLLAFRPSHDFVQLSQVSLAMIIYRRLRSLGTKLADDLTSGLVSLSITGLDSAARLAADGQPWHHCANIPFQILCTFLLLDTRDSLASVAHALSTIRRICDCFPTPTMMNTVQTATHLVDLARQRKEKDYGDLSTATSMPYSANASSNANAAGAFVQDAAAATSRGSQTGGFGGPMDGVSGAGPGAEAEAVLAAPGNNMEGLEMSPGLLEADFSSWDNIDWDQVLRTNAILGTLN